jgi:hypothetical protein
MKNILSCMSLPEYKQADRSKLFLTSKTAQKILVAKEVLFNFSFNINNVPALSSMQVNPLQLLSQQHRTVL